MAEVPAQVIDAVRKFATRVKKRMSVKKVLLFGSFAKGKYTENSDIDVCVVAEDVSNGFLAALEIAPAIIGIDLRIEPVVYSTADFDEPVSFGLLREIKTTGIEIN
jgi:uncharacterized protein